MDNTTPIPGVDADLANSHGYHKPDERRVQKHETVRQLTARLAQELRDLCPPGRDVAVAQTKLDEVRMWANKAIACN